MSGLLSLVLPLLAVPLVAAQCTTTSAIAAPTKPANDPFWIPPNNIKSRAQGSVFNCRTVNWNAMNYAGSYYQYAYKTIRSTDGSSIVAVATLIIPNGTVPGTKFNKLLAYQVPYDSPTSFCGPSFVNQPFSGSSTTNTYGVSAGADQAPSQALKAGIPVVISDYEGSIASFNVAPSSGYGTINGIRAVISASGFFNPSPQVALWGVSGGALASEFALELAGKQAQDLNIIGAALGCLTPITRNVAVEVNGFHNSGNFAQSFYNALIPYALLGVSNENATVRDWVQSNLRTTSEPGAPDQRSYKDRFNAAASDNCNVETGTDYVNSDFNNWFTGLPVSGQLFDVPIISDALNLYVIMGQVSTSGPRTVPKPPLYFYKGTADEISNISDTNNLVSKYCGLGARITYVKLENQTHSGSQTDGLNGAWAYLQARFAGTPAPSGCSTTSAS